MTASEKIDAAINYLMKRGVSGSNAAPPHYSLLWAFGAPLPPPHFQSFLGLFTFNALFFGGLFAVLALVAERHHATLEVMLLMGPSGGLVVGILCASIYRWKARRLGLPLWDDFPPPSADEDAGW